MVAERHDQMADYMQRVGAQPVELSVEGRNMLSVVDKNVVALASTGESKDLYSKTKGDHYRFLPVVLQRQVPMSLRVQKTVEVPQVRYIDEIVDEPVVMRGQVPTTQTVQKTVEASQVQFPDRVADVPVISRRHAPGLLIQEEIVEVVPPPRVCEEIAELNDAYEKFYEQLAKCMKLNFVKGVVDSKELPLNIFRETLQNKILRVIMKNHADKWLDMFAEIAEQKDDYKMFYEQFVKYMKLEIVEVLRFNTSKPGDKQNNLAEYIVDRIKEGQNDVHYITGESIAVVSFLFDENLHKKGHEVPYMADPVDECAVHQFKEFGGKMLNPTLKEGLNLVDDDEKETLEEELKANLEPSTKLMNDVVGDKVEMVITSDRIVDSPCVPTTSECEYGWSAKMKRIVEAQVLRDKSMTSHMVSKKTMEVNPAAWRQQHKSNEQQPQMARQATQQERNRGQEARKKEEEREVEERGSEQVEKDAMDWTVVTRSKRKQRRVQIFVKVNGSKATPIEVNLTDDKVEDIMRQVQNDENAYVTLHGMLKRGEKLKSCGVADGCTIQITSRLRGGGNHKDKKGKVKKKQVTRQEPVRNEGPAILGSEKEADGLCAMACEQMRWAIETMITLQSTDEDKRRIAEVEKVKKAMAGIVEKQATGGDLQRMAEMEESFKKLEKEVHTKNVKTGDKKTTREDRECAGLVQGRDETHRKNETDGQGKGKGNGGKGEHGGKGEGGGKGVQQSAKMMEDEEDQEADEEDERGRVAPNMGAGGSHPQATSDPRKREEEKRKARVLSWADCKDEEVQENEEEVEQEKETRQEEELVGEKPPGLEANEESEHEVKEDEEQRRAQETQEEEQRRAQEAEEKRLAQEARGRKRAGRRKRERSREERRRCERSRRKRKRRERKRECRKHKREKRGLKKSEKN